jgi:hypothetical protein
MVLVKTATEETPTRRTPWAIAGFHFGLATIVFTSLAAEHLEPRLLPFVLFCAVGAAASFVMCLTRVIQSGGAVKGWCLATAGIVLPLIGFFIGTHSIKVRSRQITAAARVQTASQMRHLLIALHEYQGLRGHLPPAAIRSKDGKPLLSWRVAILPYIAEEPLYRRFKLDEPWDSPTNLPLLAKCRRCLKARDIGETQSHLFSSVRWARRCLRAGSAAPFVPGFSGRHQSHDSSNRGRRAGALVEARGCGVRSRWPLAETGRRVQRKISFPVFRPGSVEGHDRGHGRRRCALVRAPF